MIILDHAMPLARSLDLVVDHIPKTVRDLPVYVNPRLSRCFGRYCWDRRKPVSAWIDLHPATLKDRDIYREVLGHELAHAIVPGHGHDPTWAKVCRSLGGLARRQIPFEVAERLGMRDRLKVVAVCTRCRFEVKQARRLIKGRTYRHVGCGGAIESL